MSVHTHHTVAKDVVVVATNALGEDEITDGDDDTRDSEGETHTNSQPESVEPLALRAVYTHQIYVDGERSLVFKRLWGCYY